jgi:hypothetical protein
MAYHETFWVVVATVAPVLALAHFVTQATSWWGSLRVVDRARAAELRGQKAPRADFLEYVTRFAMTVLADAGGLSSVYAFLAGLAALSSGRDPSWAHIGWVHLALAGSMVLLLVAAIVQSSVRRIGMPGEPEVPTPSG